MTCDSIQIMFFGYNGICKLGKNIMENQNSYLDLLNLQTLQDNGSLNKKFLAVENNTILRLIEELKADGIHCDYTILSVPSVLNWIMSKIRMKYDTMNEENNLENYKDISSLMLHASYYFGESFVNSVHTLSWEMRNDEGNRVTPMVVGFKYNFRMSPITEIRDTYNRALVTKGSSEHIDNIVLDWLLKV